MSHLRRGFVSGMAECGGGFVLEWGSASAVAESGESGEKQLPLRWDVREQKEAVPPCLGGARVGLELSPLSQQGVTMAAQGDRANQCLLSKQGLASCVGSPMWPRVWQRASRWVSKNISLLPLSHSGQKTEVRSRKDSGLIGGFENPELRGVGKERPEDSELPPWPPA